jgi:hypothetical protein
MKLIETQPQDLIQASTCLPQQPKASAALRPAHVTFVCGCR